MYLAHHQLENINTAAAAAAAAVITDVVMVILITVQVYMESILECHNIGYCGVWRPACIRAH